MVTGYSRGNWCSEKLNHFLKISQDQVGELGFKLILFSLYHVDLFFAHLVYVLRNFCGSREGERTQDIGVVR